MDEPAEAGGGLGGGELASMRAIVAVLGQLPAAAWEAELGRASAPVKPARRHAVSNRPRWAGALVTAVLALTFVAGALTHPFSGASNTRPPSLAAAPHVALQPLPGAPRDSAAVAYMPGGDHMVLDVRRLPESRPGTYYELWLMNSDTSLVSVTSFRITAGSAPTLRLVLPDVPSHYRYLDISVQQVGGSSGISEDSVLRGSI